MDIKHKKLAGFAIDECRVFVREETLSLWNAIEHTVQLNQNLRISGPPGTGKSTEAWAWACWKARESKKKVVWFHFSKNRSTKVVIDGSLDFKQITTGYSANIEDINKCSDGDFLVVDGVTKTESINISRACSAWRETCPDRVFVIVTSVSIPIPLQDDEEADINLHEVPSWTLEQYQLACNDIPFYDSVKHNLNTPECIPVENKDDCILSKYFYAGGCARWMFEFNMERFQKDFESHFQKVDNFKDVYVQGGGDQKADAVNHLRGLTIRHNEKNYFFISQYATRRLSSKCDNARQFIIDGYNKADQTGNPSFRGWIFEFDVDYQLRQANSNKEMLLVSIRSNQINQPDQEEKWTVDQYVTFKSTDELLSLLKVISADQHLWVKPNLWCQKAYDFLHFYKHAGDLVMVAVNASHAKKHAVLLSELYNLGRKLALQDSSVTSIAFRFVVPSGEKFEVGNIEGRLDDWKWPPTKSLMIDQSHIAIANIVRTLI